MSTDRAAFVAGIAGGLVLVSGILGEPWWLGVGVASLVGSVWCFYWLLGSFAPSWLEGSDRLAPAYVPRGFVGTVKMPPVPDEVLNKPPPSAAPIPQNRRDTDRKAPGW